MHTVDAIHDLLGVVPAVITDRGIGQPSTAYYQDVPLQALPSSCKLVQTDTGFAMTGTVGDFAYQGNLIAGSDPTRFRRAVVSFLRTPEPVKVH